MGSGVIIDRSTGYQTLPICTGMLELGAIKTGTMNPGSLQSTYLLNYIYEVGWLIVV